MAGEEEPLPVRVFAAGPRSGSQPGHHKHDDDHDDYDDNNDHDDHDNFDYVRVNIPDSLLVEGGGDEAIAGVGSRPVHLGHCQSERNQLLFNVDL